MKLPWATTAGLVTDGPRISRTHWLHSLQRLQVPLTTIDPGVFGFTKNLNAAEAKAGCSHLVELSFADRSGMGVRLPGRLHWTLLLWQFAKGTGSFANFCGCRAPPAGLRLPLRRSNLRRRHGQTSGANRFVPAQCMGNSRHARKRKRDRADGYLNAACAEVLILGNKESRKGTW